MSRSRSEDSRLGQSFGRPFASTLPALEQRVGVGRGALSALRTPRTTDTADAHTNARARPPATMTKYVCGNCGAPTELEQHEQFRCQRCSCRYVYKLRTKKPIQLEAR